jgi:hypothetical protein
MSTWTAPQPGSVRSVESSKFNTQSTGPRLTNVCLFCPNGIVRNGKKKDRATRLNLNDFQSTDSKQICKADLPPTPIRCVCTAVHASDPDRAGGSRRARPGIRPQIAGEAANHHDVDFEEGETLTRVRHRSYVDRQRVGLEFGPGGAEVNSQGRFAPGIRIRNEDPAPEIRTTVAPFRGS